MHELRRNRIIGAVIALAALTPLLIAANLTPAPEGLGTHHSSLGLPACGFYLATGGVPCATCGMTTAFAHAAHGHPLRAWHTQPAGMILSVACAALALVGGWAAVSGMSLRPLGAALARPIVFVAGVGMILSSWGYTIWVHTY